ncbi:MAG: acyltransferase family protein [Reyranellaceae bacterium]
MISTTDGRRSDIDWLRVLAFSLLILYHAGMPYVDWAWHIKNAEHWPALQEAMRFVNRWRMPLIFLIAGATIMLALGRRGAGAFVLDRLKRLLLPLAFGMLVIVPPQIYFERRQQGRFAGSFWEFLPQAFDGGAYPDGNVSWHHLWFLAYVLVLTLVLLPLFLWLRGGRGAALADRWSRFAARRHLVPLLALPLFASQFWLLPVSVNRNGLVGDWHGLVANGVLLLAGALLYRSPVLLDWLLRARVAALGVGIAAYALLEIFFFAPGGIVPGGADWLGFSALSAVNLVAWLIAITGFARALARPSRFLAYATPAVYPFYILHQTVTVAAAFYLVQTGWPVAAKYPLTVAATFLLTWLLYEGLVRRIALLRLLFGMAPDKAAMPKHALKPT